MKILCVCNDKAELKLVTGQLANQGHEVDNTPSGLLAINTLGTTPYDFVLLLESGSDLFSSEPVVGFAGKHHIPSLVLEYMDNAEDMQPAVRDSVYAWNNELVTTKSPTTLSKISALVSRACEYWNNQWGTVRAC